MGIRQTEKLIDSDKVDILSAPVYSGILMGVRDKVHGSKTILIVSNAGADASAARSGSFGAMSSGGRGSGGVSRTLGSDHAHEHHGRGGYVLHGNDVRQRVRCTS
jgi:hypothetical protein